MGKLSRKLKVWWIRILGKVVNRVWGRSTGLIRYLIESPLMILVISYLVSVWVLNSVGNSSDLWVILGICICGIVVGTAFAVVGKHVAISKTIDPLLVGLLLSFGRIFFLNLEEGAIRDGFKSLIDKNGSFHGILVEPPDYDHEFAKYVFRVSDLSNTTNANVILSGPRFPRIFPGQICYLSGKLVEPKSGSDFDYKSYLKNRYIYFEMQRPEINCQEGNISPAYGFYNSVYRIKSNILTMFQRHLSEPQASLSLGILFGEKRVFEESFEENLRNAGLTHVVSASGYNISIIAGFLNKTLIFLSKRIRLGLIIASIWGFAFIAGFVPSIVRACIMMSFVLFGLMTGRKASIHLSLPISAFIFALFDPRIIFNLSFQLSFLSTAGLVYVLPVFERLIEVLKIRIGGSVWMRGILLFCETTATTLSCIVTTLPLTFFTFGKISLLSLFSNVLALPVVEPVMFLSFLGMLGLMLNEFVGSLIMLLVWGLLKYFELIVIFFGSLPGSVIEFDFKVSSVFLIVAYLAMFILVLSTYPRSVKFSNYYFGETE